MKAPGNTSKSTRRFLAAALAVLVAAGLLVLAASPASLAWTSIAPPDIGTGISCVAGTDPAHVWIGSSQGIYFNDGSTWSRQSAFSALSMAAADATHVWAGGENGSIYFFNGSSWVNQSPGLTTLPVRAISVYDTTHAWAVAGDNPGEGYCVMNRDAAGWHVSDSAAGGPGLLGVYALDANHVWAVGHNGRIRFFNGTSWATQASGTTEHLRSVAGLDAAHVWAVGATSLSGKGTVMFFNGTGWTTQAIIKDESGNNHLALWSVAALDSRHVYAAGDLGTVGFYDGSTWTSQATGSGDHLASACAAGGKYVWIAGGAGSPLLFYDNPGEYNYYFAEGTTREGFEEWLCLMNPGKAQIQVDATYMLFGAEPVKKSYRLAPTSRLSVKVNDEVGTGKDVAVSLTCPSQFYAERPMYFNYKMSSPGFGWTGGSCVTGVRQASRDWLFAEGTTRDGFEEWICLQNPGGFDTQVTIDYIFAGAYTVQKKYVVAKQSRLSVFVNGDVGPGQDISARVHSDTPIVAERPMYFNYNGVWTGGHCVAGVSGPATTWHFAEGTTRSGFEEYLAVSNMNPTVAGLTIRFLKTDGTETVGNEQVPANSRWTLNVRDKLGVDVDSAVRIESTLPVVAERPMYFSYGPNWTGGHDVVGAPYPKSTWYFAEGCTYYNFNEWICIANPNDREVSVAMDYMLETGKTIHKTLKVQARSRTTVNVAADVGLTHNVSTRVSSNAGIVVERPMYFDYGPGWNGGHDVMGM